MDAYPLEFQLPVLQWLSKGFTPQNPVVPLLYSQLEEVQRVLVILRALFRVCLEAARHDHGEKVGPSLRQPCACFTQASKLDKY